MNRLILFLTLISSIVSLYLQFQNRKLRKLEEEKMSTEKKLFKSLKSIQGYQNFIDEIASEKGKTTESLKAEIHSRYKDSFIDTKFLEPAQIQQTINKYE